MHELVWLQNPNVTNILPDWDSYNTDCIYIKPMLYTATVWGLHKVLT